MSPELLSIARQRRKMFDAHYKAVSEVGALEGMIADSVDFDFSISHQPADGFVLLRYETSDVATLDDCLDIIKRGDKLTPELHNKLSI